METIIEYWVFHNNYMSSRDYDNLEDAERQYALLYVTGAKNLVLEERTRKVLRKSEGIM